MSDNLDGLINKLDTLANNAKELDGTHKIPVTGEEYVVRKLGF